MQLRHKIALYIPSALCGTIPVDEATLLNCQRRAKSMFADCFGNCTAIQGTGYRRELGVLIEEPVMIVYSFMSEEAKTNHWMSIRQFALTIGRELKQESIGMETDGYFEALPMPKLKPFYNKETAEWLASTSTRG